jgi:hypothetical protein
MDTKDKEIGQTLIETVFVLALLLILIFGIAEFARAWYLKNSLNNASRVGARVAIVQFTLNGTTDPGGDSCGSGSDAIKMVIDAVCSSAGIVGSDKIIKVKVEFPDTDGDGKANTGDLVTVTVNLTFTSGKFTVFSGLIHNRGFYRG